MYTRGLWFRNERHTWIYFSFTLAIMVMLIMPGKCEENNPHLCWHRLPYGSKAHRRRVDRHVPAIRAPFTTRCLRRFGTQGISSGRAIGAAGTAGGMGGSRAHFLSPVATMCMFMRDDVDRSAPRFVTIILVQNIWREAIPG